VNNEFIEDSELMIFFLVSVGCEQHI